MTKCELCSHFCQLKPGEVGKCRVRIEKNGSVVPTTYGMVSTMIVDPIEQRPFYHFNPGSKCLSVGGLGCNMFCSFCQNFEISQTNKSATTTFSPMAIANIAKEKNVPAIAFTYSEPLVWYEFVRDTFVMARIKGLSTLLKTNGMCSELKFQQMMQLTTAVNIDIKGDVQDYKKICGVDEKAFESVMRNIVYAAKITHLECSIVVYPGSADRILQVLSRLSSDIQDFKDVPLHLLRFIPDFKMKDVIPTSVDELVYLQMKCKHKNAYIQFAGEDNHTRCKSCNTDIVGRNGTRILYNHLQGDECPVCGGDHGINLCYTNTSVQNAQKL